MTRPLLLGHRGARASRHIPENTVASFELCLQHGCDGFTFGARAFLDIELKTAGLETRTAALLREHPPQKGFVVSSFLPQVLDTLHDLDATIPLGFICDNAAEILQGET